MDEDFCSQLQEQIKKNKAEQKSLKKELVSYGLKAQELTLKLEHLNSTNTLFKKIQRRLNEDDSQQLATQSASSQKLVKGDQAYDLTPETIDEPLVGPHDLRPPIFQETAYIHPDQPRQELRMIASSGETNPSLQRIRSAISQYRRPLPIVAHQHRVRPQHAREVTPLQVAKASGNGPLSPPATPPKPRFFDEYLADCSVIVKNEKGDWVELRCGICGTNASSTDRFLRGVAGFMRHSTSKHGPLRRLKDESNVECVFRTCTTREVSASEIDGIKSGQVKVPMITAQTLPKDSVVEKSNCESIVFGGEAQSTVVLPTSNKRVHEPTESTSNVHGYIPQRSNNKRIRGERIGNRDVAVADALLSQATNFSEIVNHADTSPLSTTPSTSTVSSAVSDTQSVIAELKVIERAKSLILLDDFCPCTLSGHSCILVSCKKIKLCLAQTHDGGLRCSNRSHEIKPSCPSLNTGVCPFGATCPYEHDDRPDSRAAIALSHDHLNH